MKKIILLPIVALMCSISVIANPLVLRRRAMYQHGGMRMPSITQVSADYGNGFLTVNVQKYSGMVWVYIYDADGNVSGINVSNINGNGTIDTDVSSLPNGEYSIDIVISDNTYTGNFAI